MALVAQLCPGFSGHARGDGWDAASAPLPPLLLHSCLSLPAAVPPLHVIISYFPAAPALLPLRAPPPKVMTSALWNEEWVILEKQLSLDRWQHELGCCIAQFPGAATQSLGLSVLLCPSTGPGHRIGS